MIKEYDPQTGKKIREYIGEKVVQVKAFRETFYYPPDVTAAKFVLTNMDPENWRNKTDTDMSIDLSMEEPPQIVFTDGTTSKDEE